MTNASNSLATARAMLTYSILSRKAASRSRRTINGMMVARTNTVITSHEVCRSRSPMQYLWYGKKLGTRLLREPLSPPTSDGGLATARTSPSSEITPKNAPRDARVNFQITKTPKRQ